MITKLKRSPGLYVVGFMGAGKTTIGKLLANEIGWSFVDLDDDIEAVSGRRITEIFETAGEPEFRRIEAEALRARVRAIESGSPTVLALGGGAYAQRGNFELVRENGITIWLDCPFDKVVQRVARAAHRPLARDPVQFAKLYEERRLFYEKADYRITIESDEPSIAVAAVMDLPIF